MVKRFGISRGVSPREPLSNVGLLAKKIEDLGFEHIWYIDHQLGMKDIYTTMNLTALATEKLKVGTAVTNLKTRHPSVTACGHAALDEISNGRALLGLGAGWVAVNSVGMRPSKIAELREGILALKALFRGEDVEYEGNKLHFAMADREIPVYLAVTQPRILKLCGEVADGAILMGAADPDLINWQLEFIYEGLEKSGRQRSDIDIDFMCTTSVQEDQRKALDDVRSWAATQAATFTEWKVIPPGWEQYRKLWDEIMADYHFESHLSLHTEHQSKVTDEWSQTVAIAGDVDYCVGRLRDVTKCDIDRITFPLHSGGRERRLETFANDVIPQVAG
jgi:5,10-methylenetetrahydromethanopterin reductase